MRKEPEEECKQLNKQTAQLLRNNTNQGSNIGFCNFDLSTKPIKKNKKKTDSYTKYSVSSAG